MEERKGFLGYATQVLVIMGFSMICMMVLTILFGEDAKEISALFSLGGTGISIAVMAEYLVLSILIVGLRYFFFTDRFLKKASVLTRTVLMVSTILVLVSIFIAVFKWFPVAMWQPWVMFLLCFLICFGCSLAISVIKTRQDNKKLEEGLARMKEQWEEEYEGWKNRS